MHVNCQWLYCNTINTNSVPKGNDLVLPMRVNEGDMQTAYDTYYLLCNAWRDHTPVTDDKETHKSEEDKLMEIERQMERKREKVHFHTSLLFLLGYTQMYESMYFFHRLYIYNKLLIFTRVYVYACINVHNSQTIYISYRSLLGYTHMPQCIYFKNSI